MKWISNLFARYWRNLHLSSIVVLSLLLLWGGKTITGPISASVTTTFYYPFYKLKNSAVTIFTVYEDNERLKKALVDASLMLTRLEEAERENTRLRGVLGFEPPEKFDLIPAKVIAVYGDPVPVGAVINRGAVDGLRPDLSLVNEQGLIGKVETVSRNTATVNLLTEPTNRVAARIGESREMGIVRFQNDVGLILDNFPIQGTVQPGDLIISSGLGGVYPEGLTVGTVDSVIRPEEALFCEVYLNPSVNFYSLEELFVLKPGEQ